MLRVAMPGRLLWIYARARLALALRLQLDDERSARVVGEITEAVLDAERGARPRTPARVWVFAHDVPEGTWGSRGKIQRLADIVAYLGGDAAAAPALAAARLAARRAERAR